ncbi:hypothetical protein [Aurantiacibacter flavus]|uniref:Chitin-binding type-3 domain-containing protein n=1 Tax=Aurantiacibacter flavus TaxID=3145232 RepID=A0ABV0CZG8_9SPHN
MIRPVQINMLAIVVAAGLTGPAVAQSVIPGWSKQFYYRYGSVVIYEGRRYRAIKPSQDKAPADNPLYWDDIGDYPTDTYTPGLGYTTPSDRAEGGISAASDVPVSTVLSGAGTTISATPSTPAEPVARDAWDRTRAYATSGQVVSYQGRRWRNTAWTQGEAPGETPVWVALDIDASDAMPEWSSTTVYGEPGLRVKHNGLTWENSGWTQGEEPGRAAVWTVKGRDSAGVEDWDNLKVYSDIGVIIRHLGRTWRNTAWTQGEEPGRAAVWVQPEADRAGAVAQWVSTSIYDLPGTIVSHNGRMWQSTAWTQGEEPGYAAVWKEYGASDPNVVAAWDSETIYSIIGTYVSYAGKVWANSAWTQGEEPGTSAVWKQITEEVPGSGTDGGEPGGEGPEEPGSGGSEEPGSGGSEEPGSGGSEEPGSGGSEEPGSGGSEEPGSGGSEEPGSGSGNGDGGVSGIPDWDATKIYDQAGTKVRHSGQVWANRWWTTGDKPGTTEAWQWVESEDGQSSWLAAWQAGYAYDNVGTEVKYQGRIWANKYWTRGEVPGESAAWRLVRSLVDEPLNWHPQMVYDAAGTIVLYEGVLWKNKWWADGKDIPGGSTGAWEAVSGGGEQGSTWVMSRGYPTGSEVDYESRRWRAESVTQGEEPGTGAAWALISATTTDPLTWNALTHYVMLNAQVRHQSRIWSNLEDSRGDVPGASAAWKLVSSETEEPLIWHQSVIYDRAGITVQHNGLLWESKWWTQNNEPGTSDAWRAIVSPDAGPQNWNSAMVYDQPGTIVIYDGMQWRNKWWSQGDIPGAPDGPWELVE